MAIDEALMERAATTGEWICRVYGWRDPTVSFGRNQAAARHYDPNLIRDRGYAVVRRPTGGRAILPHKEVTYSVAAPVTDAGGLQESYLLINRLLVTGLRSLGVHLSMASSRVQPMQPGPIPCFDHPSAGELIADDGGKIVGSAQWRSEHALLQHGSILIDDEQGELNGLLKEPGVDPPPAATLRQILGRAPSLDEAADAIFSAIGDAQPLSRLDLDQQSISRLEKHFADPAWTWRR
jgi:lipoate-protein ligase A